jgi:23S rRNA pseudouridine2604 synthase
MEEEPVFPMRLNRYLALRKYSTRRGADELIKRREVFINGRVAVLGDKVKASDKIEVRRQSEEIPLVYIAYNKPARVATQESLDKTTVDKDPSLKGIFPIGGIDKDAHGLIILTNDGRITEKLLSSNHGIEREYLVTTKEPLRSNFKHKMESGIRIEGQQLQKCKVKVLNEKTFRITLTEEKKHQIKRMCVAAFQEVKDLQRLRIQNISLGTLREGSYRKIEGDELKLFLRSL